MIVDESKLCEQLGLGFPLPVEISQFCHQHTMRVIEKLPSFKDRCRVGLRFGSISNNRHDGDQPAVTDNGNYMVDLYFTEPLKNPAMAAKELKYTTGVVDHGLFINMAAACVIAGSNGVTVKVAAKHLRLEQS